MHLLPRPGAEAGKERSRRAALRYLPRIAREVSPPRQHSQTRLHHLPRGPGRRLRQRRPWPGPQDRQRRRARLRDCATAAPTNCCRPSPRPSAPPCRTPAACATARWSSNTAPACTARRLARGITQAPLCTDCHGEHKIIKHTNEASPVNAAHIRDTCGSCHGDVLLTRKFGLPSDRLVSFDSSFHGLAAKAGNQTVANCASCHGVHNILPSSDPKSHHQRQESAQDLRPVPSRRRNAFCHQPGARGGGQDRTGAAAHGCASFTCC